MKKILTPERLRQFGQGVVDAAISKVADSVVEILEEALGNVADTEQWVDAELQVFKEGQTYQLPEGTFEKLEAGAVGVCFRCNNPKTEIKARVVGYTAFGSDKYINLEPFYDKDFTLICGAGIPKTNVLEFMYRLPQ